MVHIHIEVRTNKVKFPDGPLTCCICVAFLTTLSEQEAIEAAAATALLASSSISINQIPIEVRTNL